MWGQRPQPSAPLGFAFGASDKDLVGLSIFQLRAGGVLERAAHSEGRGEAVPGACVPLSPLSGGG